MLFGHIRLFSHIVRKIEQMDIALRIGFLSGFRGPPIRGAALQFPIADSQAEVAALAVILLNEMVAAFGSRFAEQCTEDIEAVQTRLCWQFDTSQRSETGGEVDCANNVVR